MTMANQLSFLPEDYLDRKLRKRTNMLCAILFALVMGAIGSAFWLTQRSMRKIEERQVLVQKQYTEAARPIEQFRLLQQKQQRLSRQAELSGSLLEKVNRSNLLAELTNTLPARVSLLELSLDSRKRAAVVAPVKGTAFERKAADTAAKGPPPPEPQVMDVSMKITGVADTDVQVAQYISRLHGSSLLNDVNLLISEPFMQDQEQLRRFQIELSVDAAAQTSPATRPARTAAVELK